MTGDDDLQAEIERLRAENAALKVQQTKETRLKVSQKGSGLAVRDSAFPDHLLRGRMGHRLNMTDEVRTFITEIEGELKRK